MCTKAHVINRANDRNWEYVNADKVQWMIFAEEIAFFIMVL